jgi:ferric-dicitrate binding protein FerR (iron transport regulator)
LARVEQAQDARFLPAVGSIPVFGIPEHIHEANRRWRDLFSNALLDRGEIKTGRTGNGVVGLATGNKLRVGASSDLSLEVLRHELEPGATELELRRGEVQSQPIEQTQRDRALLVRTAAVTIEAKGARFSVRHAVDKQLTTVSVLEGSVRVGRRDGGASITLAAGQQVSVSKGANQLPAPRSIE